MPRAVLALGLAGALALVGAASLDFGDPTTAVRARVQRAAAAEAELARLAFDQRMRARAPFAPPLGEVLSTDGASLAPATPSLTDDLDSPRVGAASVFDTLLAAALAAAASGAPDRALGLVDEALRATEGGAPRTAREAEARLRALAWSGLLEDDAGVATHRAALLAAPPTLARYGVSYHLLAALAGPVDLEVLRAVHGALLAEALSLPAPNDSLALDPAAGLQWRPDPLLAALERAAAARTRALAPALDWGEAFRQPNRLAAAIEAWLPPALHLDDERWTLFAPRSAERSDEDTALGAARRLDGRITVFVTSTQRLADALARAPAGESGSVEVRYAPRDAVPEDAALALHAPEPLGASGLSFAVYARSYDDELTRERRRIALVRGGLLGLGLLVALTAVLASRALARERRLAALRSTFVASVSHDLRTPLASILLLVENLERGRVATDAARAKYHGALRQEAERLRRMVEDLLDASRVERGQGPRIARREVDAEAFLDELERALVERAGVAGASVAVTREAVPPTLHLDADAVRRAVWNLFENALRHGKRPGAAAEVRVQVAEHDGALEFVVSDSGPGVPARHREAIFAPYERLVDRAPRRGDERRGLADDTGTGLGLAIVRAIARAHGGDAEVADSGAGEGARFRLVVASAPDPDAPVDPPEEDVA